MTAQQFRELLETVQKVKPISQRKLSTVLGVCPSTISRWKVCGIKEFNSDRVVRKLNHYMMEG